MPLTAEEQAELKALEQSLSGEADAPSSGLTPAEQIELQVLEESLSKPVQQPQREVTPPSQPNAARPGAGGPASVSPAPPASGLEEAIRFKNEPPGDYQPPPPEPSAIQKLRDRASQYVNESYENPQKIIAEQWRSSGLDLAEVGIMSGGELAGRVAGNLLSPFAGPLAPLAPTVLGSVGSVTTMIAYRLATDKDFTVGDVLLEFGIDLGMGGIAEGTFKSARKALSRTRTGLAVGEDLAGRSLRKSGRVEGSKATELTNKLDKIMGGAQGATAKKVAAYSNDHRFFNPLERKKLDAMFSQVRATGAKISRASMAPHVKNLDKQEFAILMREIPRISEGPNHQYPGIGWKIAEAFEAMRSGKPSPSLDLGVLTHLRSQLRKRGMAARRDDVKDSLDRMTEIIDGVIDNGKYINGEKAKDLLKETRKQWAIFRDAQEFEALIHQRGITSRTKGAKRVTLDVGALVDQLDHPKDKVAQRAKAALERNPTAYSRFNDWSKKIGKVDIENGPIDDFHTINLVGHILRAGPASRERFMRIVTNRRGKINGEELVVLANMLVRSSAHQAFGSSGAPPEGQIPSWPHGQQMPQRGR